MVCLSPDWFVCRLTGLSVACLQENAFGATATTPWSMATPGGCIPPSRRHRAPPSTCATGKVTATSTSLGSVSWQHLHLWGQCHGNIYIFGINVIGVSVIYVFGVSVMANLHLWGQCHSNIYISGVVSWQHLQLWGQCHSNIYISGISVMATCTFLGSVSWQHLYLWG